MPLYRDVLQLHTVGLQSTRRCQTAQGSLKAPLCVKSWIAWP